MPTVAKKTAGKTTVRRSVAKKSAVPPTRLVPPPGPSAREVMANYPAPLKTFDAAGVERIVALRSVR